MAQSWPPVECLGQSLYLGQVRRRTNRSLRQILSRKHPSETQTWTERTQEGRMETMNKFLRVITIYWRPKSAVLLCKCISPRPPPPFDRYNTLFCTQCNLSQKKSIKIDCIFANTSAGGSIQIKRCHSAEATKLLTIKIRPLEDIFGSNTSTYPVVLLLSQQCLKL